MYSRSNSPSYYYRHVMVMIGMTWLVTLSSFVFAQQQGTDTKNLSTTPAPQIRWQDKYPWLESLRIHGFASQAYIATSANNVFGHTEKGGDFGLTELGLNASLQPLPRLQVSAQMLSRRAGEGNSGMPRLDFGFVDYRIYSHETNQFGIRVGRLKNPFGFYNDTRDVAFTRPSIMLPQSIYFDRTRNLALSADSVQIYGETSHATMGSASFQFGVLRPIVGDLDTKRALVGRAAGDMAPDVSYIGRGMYESNDKRLRLAVSGILLNVNYNPAAIDTLSSGAIHFAPVFFSAQYNTEKWTFTSEYAIRKFQFGDFGSSVAGNALNGQDAIGESYYFQGAYRFHPKWEAMLRYDVLYSNRKDRDGSDYYDNSVINPGHRPAHSRFAKDITVGLRWNITPELMLRAEYHRINGTAWLSGLDNPVPAQTEQHWNLFSTQLSYRF